MSAFPSLGVRVDALGTEAANAKINKFGASIGKLPRDFQAASRESRKLTVNMQKMSFAAFGASLAITSTVTSLSRLEKSALNVNRATVALERGTDLVTRKQQRLNQILRQGERFTGELALAQSELGTALNDVVVKEEDLRIKTGEVTDTYINFAASLGASVLFSVTAFFSAIKGLEFAQVKARIAAIKHSISLKLVRNSSIQASGAMGTMQKATVGSTIASFAATRAQFGLAAALKAVTVSFAPLLIATAAITAAFAIYELNVFGVKDALNGLLGITEETATAAEEAAAAMEEMDDAMTGAAVTAPQLVTTLDQIATQITIIAREAPLAAQGIRQIQESAVSAGGPRGTTTTRGGGAGGGTIPDINNLPFGVFSNLASPELQNQQFLIKLQNERLTSQLGILDNILKKDKRITDARAQVARILEATKNDTEAIAAIEDTIVILRQIDTELTREQANVLERALQIETLILQRKREQNLESDKAITKQQKIVQTSPFGGVNVSGLRDPQGFRGAVLKITGVDVGPKSFSSLNEAIRAANLKRTLSRFTNTRGGLTEGALSAIRLSGGVNEQGQTSATDAFQRSVGTPNAILESIARQREFTFSKAGVAQKLFNQQLFGAPQLTRRGRVSAGFGGGLGTTEKRILRENPGIARGADLILAGVKLGLYTLKEAQAFIGGGGSIQEIGNFTKAAFDQLEKELKASNVELGLGLKFGQDITSTFQSGKNPGIKGRTDTSPIGTPFELLAAKEKIDKELERRAFIVALESAIDRELRFREHLISNPDVRRPEGSSLFLDTQPLADALERILAGEQHRQFVKLLTSFKVQ